MIYIMKNFLALLLILSLHSQAAVILKTKDLKALVKLEKSTVQRGSYFEIYDLKGEPTGLLKIDRIGKRKAIGTLQLGEMRPNWSLEPKSRRWAMLKLKNQSKQRVALIQKTKRKKQMVAKRKVAKQKRMAAKKMAARRMVAKRMASKRKMIASRKIASNRKVAAKKRQLQRQLASLDSQDQYTAPNDEDEGSYDGSYSSSSNYGDIADSYASDGNVSFVLGVKPTVNWNIIKISPIGNKPPPFSLMGLGYGGTGFVDISFHKNISVEIEAGYKRFQAKSEAHSCGNNSCSLQINYILGAINLKSQLEINDTLKIFGGISGKLLFPVEFVNHANLEPFSGIHGTLGFLSGLNISLGRIQVPISLYADLIIPPTATSFIFTAGMSLGLGYKF